MNPFFQNYFKISPLFANSLIGTKKLDTFYTFNYRIFVAHSLAMLDQKRTTLRQVKSKMDNSFGPKNVDQAYQLIFFKALTGLIAPQRYSTSVLKQTYIKLLSKLYLKTISSLQFNELAHNFHQLCSEKSATQMEKYGLGISLKDIRFISKLCQFLTSQSSFDFYGKYCESFIQQECKRPIVNVFSLWNIVNKMRNNYLQQQKQMNKISIQLILFNFYSQKTNIYHYYEKQTKQIQNILKNQTVSYMMWLLHVLQLQPFIKYNVRQNYLYSQFAEKSLPVILDLFKIIKPHELKVYQKIFYYEFLGSLLERIKSDKDIKFEQVTKTEQKILKDKKQIERSLAKNNSISSEQLFSNIQEINYQSQLCISKIRIILLDLINSEHFIIKYTNIEILKMVSLAITSKNQQIAHKIMKKVKSLPKQISLAYYLELYQLDPTYTNNVQFKTEIGDIYELKRIKTSFSIISQSQLSKMNHPQEQKQMLMQLRQRILTQKYNGINREMEQYFIGFTY